MCIKREQEGNETVINCHTLAKKPLPSVVGKVAARQEPRVPIPCERTFGISRPFSRQMRHYDPAFAAFSCLGGR